MGSALSLLALSSVAFTHSSDKDAGAGREDSVITMLFSALEKRTKKNQVIPKRERMKKNRPKEAPKQIARFLATLAPLTEPTPSYLQKQNVNTWGSGRNEKPLEVTGIKRKLRGQFHHLWVTPSRLSSSSHCAVFL